MVMNLEELADKYFAKGNLYEAEDLYKRLLSKNPNNANALHKLGFINLGKQDYDNAEMLLDASLKIAGNIDTLKLLAYVKEKKFQLYDAIVMYEKVLELEPSEELFVIVGNLYIQLELYDNATKLAEDYVQKFPTILAYRRLFLIYLNLAKEFSLKALYEEIQEKFPNKGLMFNLVGMYKEHVERDYKSAISYYEKAFKAGVSIAGFDLAQCYRRIGNFDEAEKSCKKVLATYPNKNDVFNLLAEIYFLQKKMRKGYKFYLSRELNPDILGLKNKWDGKEYPGKTILVISDINDMNTIRNVRFIELLKNSFENIVVASASTMESFLIANNFKTIPLSKIFDEKYDRYVLLSELQYYLNIAFENLPKPKQYLKSTKVELKEDGMKVALFWKAPGDSMKALKEQSIDVTKYLNKLFDIEGINYYSFQTGDIFETLDKYPSIIDLSKKIENIEDMAKYISSMDLVISIDSTILHLAGALGVPSIALLPQNSSWYWFNNDNKTEWYQNMQIIRQDKGKDWDSVSNKVIERVIKDNAKYQKIK